MSDSPSAPASSASPSKEVVFHCEYAASGRAKCRVCLNSILKNSLRLAVSLPLAEPSLPEPQDEKVTKQRRIAAEAPQWCHANCFRKFRASAKWWREHMYPATRWIGFSELSSLDQKQIGRFVAACEKGEEPPHFRLDEDTQKRSETTDIKAKSGAARAAKTEEKKGSRPQTEEKKRLKAREKVQGDHAEQARERAVSPGEEGSEVPRRGTKRSNGEADKVESRRRQSQVETTQGKKRRTVNEKVREVGKVETKDVERARANAGEESIGLALTAHQQQDIETQLEAAEKENAATLRSLLRMNNQKVSGPKEELAHRVAECRVLGAIPKCPQCREGFLRFDGNTGEYRCPGYVNEAGEYERCSFKSTDVKRLRWKE